MWFLLGEGFEVGRSEDAFNSACWTYVTAWMATMVVIIMIMITLI